MGLKRTLLRCLPTSTNRLRWSAARFTRRTLTTEMLRRMEETPGCLNREQGSLLYYLSANPRSSGVVVEIGSFMGRSTLWLAYGVQRAGRGRVVAIDPHDGHSRPEVLAKLDSYAMFLRNVRDAGLAELVEPIRERSQQVARRWNEPIRLLWVDGSHDYDDVLADLEGFGRHVQPGAHVALHDTRGRRFPGVKRAMLEYFAREPGFTRIASLRNMVVYERDATPPPAWQSPSCCGDRRR